MSAEGLFYLQLTTKIIITNEPSPVGGPKGWSHSYTYSSDDCKRLGASAGCFGALGSQVVEEGQAGEDYLFY
jgi:hypothetical protein